MRIIEGNVNRNIANEVNKGVKSIMMKLVEHNLKGAVPFKEIEKGSVFVSLCDDEKKRPIYLKISSLMKNDDNAVCLSDGFTPVRFSDDEYVIEIPAELHFTMA